jgi:hypothetical protein
MNRKYVPGLLIHLALDLEDDVRSESIPCLQVTWKRLKGCIVDFFAKLGLFMSAVRPFLNAELDLGPI